jgi:hypothetical protein
VSSLDHDGRVAYVPARALLRADPSAGSVLAVRLAAGADASRVSRALEPLGTTPAPTGGATARGAPLVAVLRAIIRAVAVVDGLVCLYVLVQACSVTVLERRRTVAVLRACGAGAGVVRRLLLGAALALVLPAAVVGYLVQRLLLGPAVSHLAAGYAELPLRASGADVAVTAAGLLVAAVAAVWWVARQAARESVLSGFRTAAASSFLLEPLPGAAGTSDVVDASVVIVARRYKATVISSDRADLVRLDPRLPVVDC